MKVRGTTRKGRQTGSEKDGKYFLHRARQKLLLLKKVTELAGVTPAETW